MVNKIIHQASTKLIIYDKFNLKLKIDTKHHFKTHPHQLRVWFFAALNICRNQFQPKAAPMAVQNPPWLG